MAAAAVCQGETGIAGLICRYGYYGGLAPAGGMPPMLVVHGQNDMAVSQAVEQFTGQTAFRPAAPAGS